MLHTEYIKAQQAQAVVAADVVEDVVPLLNPNQDAAVAVVVTKNKIKSN